MTAGILLAVAGLSLAGLLWDNWRARQRRREARLRHVGRLTDERLDRLHVIDRERRLD